MYKLQNIGVNHFRALMEYNIFMLCCLHDTSQSYETFCENTHHSVTNTFMSIAMMNLELRENHR